MANSERTTRLTRVLFGPEGHAGGGGDEAAPIGFSNITTASPLSTFIPDGYLSICSHSGNSLVIAIRSGATTYRFTNATGSVL